MAKKRKYYEHEKNYNNIFSQEPEAHLKSLKNKPHIIYIPTYIDDYDKRIIEEHNEFLRINSNPRRRWKKELQRRQEKRRIKRNRRLSKIRSYEANGHAHGKFKKEAEYLRTGTTRKIKERRNKHLHEVAKAKRREYLEPVLMGDKSDPDNSIRTSKRKKTEQLTPKERKLREILREHRRKQKETDKKKGGDYKLVPVY